DDKIDSWEGIEPISIAATSSFMSDSSCGIKSLFMCRDDKYLYWRVDFQKANPLRKRPKGSGQRTESVLTTDLQKGGSLDMGVAFDLNQNKTYTYRGQGYPGKPWTDLGTLGMTHRGSDDRYVMRAELSQIAKYLGGVQRVQVMVANVENGKWKERSGSTQVYVDFSK
ncbi:MAG: hypothetical protein WCL50_16170, partial [Spirochaetota bacterium]